MSDESSRASYGPIGEGRQGKPWIRWILLGCLGMLVLGIAGIVALGVVVVGSVKSSGAYQHAVASAKESDTVREALGEPIEEGWWVMGSVQVSGPSGEASISFPLSGPRGKATVYADATKRAGEWHLELLVAELAEGEKVDLLEEDGTSFEVVEAFLEAAATADYEAAHGYFSRPLKEVQPYDEFAALVRGNASVFAIAELRLERIEAGDGPRYAGTLLLDGGAEVPASFELVREGGEWRLLGYEIGS